jgi:hypothetical protein
LKHDELHDKTFLTASVGLSVSGVFFCWWLGAWQTLWNRPGCRITVLTFVCPVGDEIAFSVWTVWKMGLKDYGTEGAVWWEIHRHDFNGMAIQFFGFIFIEDGKGSN